MASRWCIMPGYRVGWLATLLMVLVGVGLTTVRWYQADASEQLVGERPALSATASTLAAESGRSERTALNLKREAVIERLKQHVGFLASAECEGRGIDTQGIEKAAAYIAEEFRKAGLQPAAKDGSYFQPFVVTASARLSERPHAVLHGPDHIRLELDAGTEFSVMGFSSSGQVQAPLVFVGYGITAPELKYDDYAGLDVRGKVVVMLRRTPRPDERGERRFDRLAATPEESSHATFVSKIANAQQHGAVAVILVNDRSSAGERDPLPQFANHALGNPPAPFPVLFLKREILDRLLRTQQRTLADVEKAIDQQLHPQSLVLQGWRLQAAVRVERTEYKCKNVVGMLEGSGPLADETVIIGAHYDHIGYGTFGSLGGANARGKIHHGADDNASGTTGLIELAWRFAAQPQRPGRRLLFIAFSAEERGLYGSLHYCKEPLYPLDKTALMINMDMIGRARRVPADWLGWEKKDRLLVYGVGTATGLEQLVHQANGRPGLYLRTLASGTGPSDHDSFYRKRVPVLFLYTGTHGDYHRPSDKAETLNYEAMAEVIDYAERLVQAVMVLPEKPRYQVTREAWRDPTDPRAQTSPRAQMPRLGIRPGNYESEEGGVLVDGVTPGGPADKAGIKDGDVIIGIAGETIQNISTYMTVMSRQKAGTPIEVTVVRKGQRLTLKVIPE
ncbi:MAG: M28 family peptidase [Gemmataceae bacterium]|nr:M28 family peptidase [Gemmataceae bacterium]